MRRAISNLVDDAVKYGGGAAGVTLAPEADRVVILVEDEGPGIPRNEREKVGSGAIPAREGRSRFVRHSLDCLGTRRGGTRSCRSTPTCVDG
jgi:signal transduction histidine kinase